jgi:hypothetical protein
MDVLIKDTAGFLAGAFTRLGDNVVTTMDDTDPGLAIFVDPAPRKVRALLDLDIEQVVVVRRATRNADQVLESKWFGDADGPTFGLWLDGARPLAIPPMRMWPGLTPEDASAPLVGIGLAAAMAACWGSLEDVPSDERPSRSIYVRSHQ